MRLLNILGAQLAVCNTKLMTPGMGVLTYLPVVQSAGCLPFRHFPVLAPLEGPTVLSIPILFFLKFLLNLFKLYIYTYINQILHRMCWFSLTYCLALLSIMSSESTCYKFVSVFFSFLWLSNIIYAKYHIFFNYPSDTQVVSIILTIFKQYCNECCCSVAQSCPSLCDSMDCSSPNFLSFTISQSLLKLIPVSQ